MKIIIWSRHGNFPTGLLCQEACVCILSRHCTYSCGIIKKIACRALLQTLHPWITSSEGQSIAFYLGMILERQQSVVSGDVEKVKVNISNKLTFLCRQKRKSKYKPGTCLQHTAFWFCCRSNVEHTLSHLQLAMQNYANNGTSGPPLSRWDS